MFKNIFKKIKGLFNRHTRYLIYDQDKDEYHHIKATLVDLKSNKNRRIYEHTMDQFTMYASMNKTNSHKSLKHQCNCDECASLIKCNKDLFSE